MAKLSAGILAYQYDEQKNLCVLLVHPGGPFYIKKDLGVWSIPKGEYDEHEDALTVAMREFEEETGNKIITDNFIPLSPVKLKSGKKISAWATKASFEKCFIQSNFFEMEWPPKSGKMQSFPEVDKAEWFTIQQAKIKLYSSQVSFVEELATMNGKL
ncbi:MAG: NUDIX domain-containing protein [Chitinophagaceae bacterium]